MSELFVHTDYVADAFVRTSVDLYVITTKRKRVIGMT